MIYDTHFRHNDALHPDALTTLPNAMHALNAAIEDCGRAGRAPDRDAAVLLLIRNLALVAEREGSSPGELRMRCALDRRAVIERPALLAIARHSVGDDAPAKRTFHNQARRALHSLAQALGLEIDACRITSLLGNDRGEGTTQLAHPDLAIHVVPRGLLPHREISFWRCRDGRVASQNYDAPIAELLDPQAFGRRLKATIGDFRPASLPRAA